MVRAVMNSAPRSPRTRRRAAVLAAVLFASASATPAGAVTILVHSTDGQKEGFNDPTKANPVGGNPGTTLGEQRRFVFQYAADVWGRRLGGDVSIIVSASFDDLGGNTVSAVLGSAAPTTVHNNFPRAPFTQTWYVAALANQLYGEDQNDFFPNDCPITLVDSRCPEVVSQFNSAVDNQAVLGAVDFYYGLDGNNGIDIDFLTVVLHEIGHGLGLLDLIDPSTGALFLSLPDAYVRNLEDASFNPKNLASMTNQQRFSAIRDTQDLFWIGSAAKTLGPSLTLGKRGDGAVMIYAPTTYETGSSTSHLDTIVTPNELMEPFATSPPPRNLDMTLALLDDLGWEIEPVQACGDATDDGQVTTTDALTTLKAAVGQVECELTVCDANFSGGITAGDAQRVLQYAVGQDVTLNCPLL